MYDELDEVYFDEPVDPFENIFDMEIQRPNDGQQMIAIQDNQQFNFNPIYNQQNSLLNWRRRSPKRKVILSKEAEELKSGYYSTFTFKKTFPKELILEIHRKILSQQLGLPKMTRDERRRKDLYFQDYAFMKKEILECLKNNRETISNTILKDIKMKKPIICKETD